MYYQKIGQERHTAVDHNAMRLEDPNAIKEFLSSAPVGNLFAAAAM